MAYNQPDQPQLGGTSPEDQEKEFALPSKESPLNEDSAKDSNDEGSSDDASASYVQGIPLACVVAGLTLAVFCLSLVRLHCSPLPRNHN